MGARSSTAATPNAGATAAVATTTMARDSSSTTTTHGASSSATGSSTTSEDPSLGVIWVSVTSKDFAIRPPPPDWCLEARNFFKYFMTKPAMEDKSWLRHCYSDIHIVSRLRYWLLDGSKSIDLFTFTVNPYLSTRGYVPYGLFRDKCKELYGLLPGDVPPAIATTGDFRLDFVLHPAESPEEMESVLRKGVNTAPEIRAKLFTRSVQMAVDYAYLEGGQCPAVLCLAIFGSKEPARPSCRRVMCSPLHVLPVAVAYLVDKDNQPHSFHPCPVLRIESRPE